MAKSAFEFGLSTPPSTSLTADAEKDGFAHLGLRVDLALVLPGVPQLRVLDLGRSWDEMGFNSRLLSRLPSEIGKSFLHNDTGQGDSSTERGGLSVVRF